MTAKEKLQDVVELLSEAEAEATIGYIADLRRHAAAARTDVRDGRAGSDEAVSREDRPRRRYGLRAMTAVPAALLIALFIAAYTALLVIVVVVVARG